MFREFFAMVDGHKRRFINEWQQTRMIMAAWIGGEEARKQIPLPGDFDHLPEPTQENKYRLAKAWGVAEKWNVKPE